MTKWIDENWMIWRHDEFHFVRCRQELDHLIVSYNLTLPIILIIISNPLLPTYETTRDSFQISFEKTII